MDHICRGVLWITFVGESFGSHLRGVLWITFEGSPLDHICRGVLWITFEGSPLDHICRGVLWITFEGSPLDHICRGVLWITFEGSPLDHICRGVLWITFEGSPLDHICRGVLWITFVGESFGSHLRGVLLDHICRGVLWITFCFLYQQCPKGVGGGGGGVTIITGIQVPINAQDKEHKIMFYLCNHAARWSMQTARLCCSYTHSRACNGCQLVGGCTCTGEWIWESYFHGMETCSNYMGFEFIRDLFHPHDILMHITWKGMCILYHKSRMPGQYAVNIRPCMGMKYFLRGKSS